MSVICGNAGCYGSRKVKEHLEDSRVVVMFLPPYASNRNLIERYCRFFKKLRLYICY